MYLNFTGLSTSRMLSRFDLYFLSFYIAYTSFNTISPSLPKIIATDDLPFTEEIYPSMLL